MQTDIVRNDVILYEILPNYFVNIPSFTEDTYNWVVNVIADFYSSNFLSRFRANCRDS